MTGTTQSTAAERPAAGEASGGFWSLPLLLGEDEASYERMHARIWQTVKPADVIEEIWCTTWSISSGTCTGCGT
jgi:hypothetical protein